MAYFRNRSINLLNLHYAVRSLAMTGSGAFYTVFLLKAGVAIPAVLATLAAILFGRFLLRPMVLPLALRYGLKPLLIIGTLGSALQYPVLAEVHGVGPTLYALILLSALGDSLYWTSYHAYFAALGDAADRGQQIGAREAAVNLISIIAPLVTGWALVVLGARVTFYATALVIVTAALPLASTRNVVVARQAPKALRAALPGMLLFVCDGFLAAGLIFLWRLTLFVALGQNFEGFGAAVAVAALVGAVAGLVLGRFIDAGHGRHAALLTFAVLVAGIIIRAISYSDATWAVIANAAGALVYCIYTPTLMTAVYNRSQRSPCVARFHIATEGGWDIGGSAGLALAALVLHLGVSMGVAILLSLPGALAAYLLLQRHYAAADDAEAAIVSAVAGVAGVTPPMG